MGFKKIDIVGIIALVASSVICVGDLSAVKIALLMANCIGIGMFLAFGWIK